MDSDPKLNERIWGQRIAQVGQDGYTEAYNDERKVDERLLQLALSAREQAGLALDVGTYFPETPRALVRRGWSVVCLDLSMEVCKRVKTMGNGDSGHGLWPVRADATALPFRNQTFDLVTDFVTAVVIEQAAKVIKEEVRTLKLKASYVLVTNNSWTRSGKANLAMQRRTGGRHPRWGHFSPLSPLDLWAIAKKHQLRLVAVDSQGHSHWNSGYWQTVLGYMLPFLKRFLGWRLGAVYKKTE